MHFPFKYVKYFFYAFIPKMLKIYICTYNCMTIRTLKITLATYRFRVNICESGFRLDTLEPEIRVLVLNLNCDVIIGVTDELKIGGDDPHVAHASGLWSILFNIYYNSTKKLDSFVNL